jgi:hypothetical protein
MSVADFNMMTGRVMAVSLFNVSHRPKQLPTSIQDVRTRARLVDDIDKTMGQHFGSFRLIPYVEGQICVLSQSLFDAMLEDVTTQAKKQINDVDNDNMRNGVALILWSGCIAAAKVIALGTRSGANTPQSRKDVLTNLINPLCDIDELYKAGVETAPVFKSLRKEDVNFDGVPAGSPVLMYKDMSY